LNRSGLAVWLWAGMVGLLLAHNLYIWLGARLATDSDILALLPVENRDPVLEKAFAHMVESAQQRLVVLVGAADWDTAVRAADRYLEALAPGKNLLTSDEEISPKREQDWLGLFHKHRLVLMTADDETALRDRDKQYWVDVALTKLYSPGFSIKAGAWQDDPFGLFGAWLQERARETPVRPRDGRLFVAEGARVYVVLPLMVRVPTFSMVAQAALVPLLENARQAARRADSQVEVTVAGIVLYAGAAAAQAKWELSTIGIGSLLGVVALIWLTFHSLKPIALITLSVGVGCLGALSVCSLLFERIHLLTLVFGASLIGGAQDYGTYFLCHRLGADDQLDSHQLLRRLLPSLTLALITTVAGYLALALTPFPGLRQMALFSALGLIFAWLTVIFWFPALASSRDSEGGGPLVRWCAVSLQYWPRIEAYRLTLTKVAVLGLLAALAAFGFARLHAQDDVRLLQNPPKRLIDEQIQLSRVLDAPAPAQFFVARGETAETVLRREETLKQRLDKLVEAKLISGYQAVSNWVPSLRTQEVRRAVVDERLLNGAGALPVLSRRIGSDDIWIAATRERLSKSGEKLTPEEFLSTSAGASVRHLWLGPVSGGYATVVALRGVSAQSLPRLREAGSGLEGIEWVDRVGAISEILARYRTYMSWVVLFSYVAVYALLYRRYRGATWRVVAPTALASIAAMALLGLNGQGVQLFHVLALMLLLGVGIDYGIFLQEEPSRRDPIAWLAVVLSALGTILSFGLLGLSRTPALRSCGLTMVIGTMTVWFLAPCFAGAKQRGET
jgi:predicted exporter